ncbi:unnamed protein product [Nippostrongylus brasiliensis]|uniref:Aldehyde dehydrogenase (inferred by orthology to a D. melanogaster protein) n=1 Tax=Nippostrongylus brasiliensis TaxID=27835 RepID=A0A0N4YCX6_NIPBR|nr:unnamed protein product [Nippostrongylus brasiliensis]
MERTTSHLSEVEKTFATALDQPMIIKEPFGVVLIIAPWNYPELFFKEFVAVVNGGVAETTELLKERFDHILYTGCPPVAKIIMAAAAKHLTPVTLELGGKCPVVVEDDADVETTAKRIAWGKWLNCGQTCLAPDYVMVSAATKPKLVDCIRRSLGEFYGADIRSSADYSRIINQRHFDRISSLLDSTNGTVLFKGGEKDRNDLFLPPVILDVKKDDPFMHDEVRPFHSNSLMVRSD